MRDEFRQDFDSGRGGYGRQVRQEPEAYTEFQSATGAPTAGVKRQREEEPSGGAAASSAAAEGGFAPPPPSNAFTAEADGLGHDAKRNPRFRERDDDASE